MPVQTLFVVLLKIKTVFFVESKGALVPPMTADAVNDERTVSANVAAENVLENRIRPQ